MDGESSGAVRVIRVGLAAPPGALRAGLRALLSESERLRVVTESAAPDELLEEPAALDVIVSTAPARRDEGGEAPLPLLLVLPGDALNGIHPPARGAWGALPLESDASALEAAVCSLYEGLVVLPPQWAGELLSPSAPRGDPDAVEALTAREMDVLQQLALGLTNKQIALALGISDNTVKYHISAVYSKLGVMNRAEAVHAGIRRGWINI